MRGGGSPKTSSPTLALVWQMVISRSCMIISLSLSLSLSLDFLQYLGTCRQGDHVSGGVVELGELVRKEGRGGVVGVEF